MKQALLVTVSAGTLGLATPVAAQTADTTPAATNSEQGAAVSAATPPSEGLAEIVVTAQRVAENSQKAPVAIDVIKPDELVRQNVVRAEDLSRTSPALSTTSGGGPTTIFFVRGVGNTTVNAYSDPAIAFNYD